MPTVHIESPAIGGLALCGARRHAGNLVSVQFEYVASGEPLQVVTCAACKRERRERDAYNAENAAVRMRRDAIRDRQ